MTVVAVIDTSVWVSAFLNPDGYPARLTKAGKTGTFLIVSSLPLLDELHEVLLRPRVMKIRQSTETDVNVFIASVGAVVQLALCLANCGSAEIPTTMSSWKRRFRGMQLTWSVEIRT